jgi:hypothetical protein
LFRYLLDRGRRFFSELRLYEKKELRIGRREPFDEPLGYKSGKSSEKNGFVKRHRDSILVRRVLNCESEDVLGFL